MAEEPQAVVLVDNDAMNLMLDVYMAGFGSGAASAFTALDAPESEAKRLAHQMVSMTTGDPLIVETIRVTITGLLAARAEDGA